MLNDVEVSIQFSVASGHADAALKDELSYSVMAIVEDGLQQAGGPCQAFDPYTGEPVYAIPQVDPEILRCIRSVTVMAPSAMADALLHATTPTEEPMDDGSILIPVWDGDD